MTADTAQPVLIKGGQLIDGTGAPLLSADLRIAHGIITEIGPNLRSGGERVFDASGCFVTPGFIDSHTHYDAALFWDPTCDPITLHGVTTVLIGNCGLGLAPIRGGDVAGLSSLFSYIEDLPRNLFETEISWKWERFEDYVGAMGARSYGVNVASLVSHSLLRQYVMGNDAWSRAATANERGHIASELEASLQAGAFGVSTSRFDRSPEGAHVPSFHADDEEFRAIFGMLKKYAGLLQTIPELGDAAQQEIDLRRMGNFSRQFETPVLSNAIFHRPDSPEYAHRFLELGREMRQAGARFQYLASPRSIEVRVNFHQCMVFIYASAWNAVVQSGRTTEEKKAILADPAWRARARADWDSVRDAFPGAGMSERMRVVEVNRPDYEKYLGTPFEVIVKERRQHPSDTLADWALENDLNTEFVYPFTNVDPNEVGKLLTANECLISGSDAGAHIGMFDGAGDTTLVLTRHVRDRPDLTLESAVHRMTGQQAAVLGLANRGVIRPGAAADIAVFDLDRLEWNSDVKVKDVPGGRARFRRSCSGYRFTFVNGALVQESGKATGTLPARFLGAADRTMPKDVSLSAGAR